MEGRERSLQDIVIDPSIWAQAVLLFNVFLVFFIECDTWLIFWGRRVNVGAISDLFRGVRFDNCMCLPIHQNQSQASDHEKNWKRRQFLLERIYCLIADEGRGQIQGAFHCGVFVYDSDHEIILLTFSCTFFVRTFENLNIFNVLKPNNSRELHLHGKQTAWKRFCDGFLSILSWALSREATSLKEGTTLPSIFFICWTTRPSPFTSNS